jgi:hypothetical protein
MPLDRPALRIGSRKHIEIWWTDDKLFLKAWSYNDSRTIIYIYDIDTLLESETSMFSLVYRPSYTAENDSCLREIFLGKLMRADIASTNIYCIM